MRCYVCGCEVTTSYYKDFWGHCVCASHLNDGSVSRCSSCYGYTKTNTALPDGRLYCPECRKNAIFMNDDKNIRPVLDYTLKNLTRIGFDNLKMDNVTIEITTHEKLMRILGPSRHNMVLGLACTSYDGYEYSHKIYMLDYQNRTEFTSTLAHELLHAWQYQHGMKAPTKVCEGICNLGAYYLLYTIKTDLSRAIIDAMVKNPDHIYGQGFRDVHAECIKMGWKNYIEHIKRKYKR